MWCVRSLAAISEPSVLCTIFEDTRVASAERVCVSPKMHRRNIWELIGQKVVRGKTWFLLWKAKGFPYWDWSTSHTTFILYYAYVHLPPLMQNHENNRSSSCRHTAALISRLSSTWLSPERAFIITVFFITITVRITHTNSYSLSNTNNTAYN